MSVLCGLCGILVFTLYGGANLLHDISWCAAGCAGWENGVCRVWHGLCRELVSMCVVQGCGRGCAWGLGWVGGEGSTGRGNG